MTGIKALYVKWQNSHTPFFLPFLVLMSFRHPVQTPIHHGFLRPVITFSYILFPQICQSSSTDLGLMPFISNLLWFRLPKDFCNFRVDWRQYIVKLRHSNEEIFAIEMWDLLSFCYDHLSCYIRLMGVANHSTELKTFQGFKIVLCLENFRPWIVLWPDQ